MIEDIGALTVSDLPRCLSLAGDRGWPPEERKWRLLFEMGTVFGVSDEAGDLAGTTILTRYGSSLSVISMVLVASRHGRRGLGQRLVTHALTRAETRNVTLFATELGRPLYERLGFTAVEPLHTYVGAGAVPVIAPRSRPATRDDLEAVARLDAVVNGVPRRPLLERWFSFAVRLRVLERDGNIVGYGAAWRNLDHTLIGPVVAEDDRAAAALIGDLAIGVDGPVRVDLLDRHSSARDWAQRNGLSWRSSSMMMIRGAPDLPGDRSRWFSPAMQALG